MYCYYLLKAPLWCTLSSCFFKIILPVKLQYSFHFGSTTYRTTCNYITQNYKLTNEILKRGKLKKSLYFQTIFHVIS